ncbi:MAG: glycosyl transferase group 1 protein [Candidatus Peregrinibacteria bacterium GW2011_GWC2_39_14]|nr:MAG: glycosyl transferase group 1 protein [Candidatus Peregrinibacteria bacterium GW2011_GWC2_39_14]
MPKNILFYTDTPICGGAERQMTILAKFLDKQKYNLFLACAKAKSVDDLAEKFEKTGSKIFRLNVIHKHDPRHYFQLKKIIRENKIEILHAHVWNPASCRYAYLASKSCKIPLVITEHDPGEISPLKTAFKKWLLKNASKIIAISEENKKLLKALYPHVASKISVVHNGIDIAEFEKKITHAQSNPNQNNPKTILTVAALHPRKGLKYLIEAFSKINDKNLQLQIVGEGPQKQELQELTRKLNLSEQVKFLGWRNDIPELMASANMFVLPSLHEAFGLVLLEAILAKLPIIATNSGGIPEIIENNKNGLLVPPKDAETLANTIKILLENDELNKKFVQAGLEKVYEKFNAETMAKKTEIIYDRALSAN